jgi:hypothetical protein
VISPISLSQHRSNDPPFFIHSTEDQIIPHFSFTTEDQMIPHFLIHNSADQMIAPIQTKTVSWGSRPHDVALHEETKEQAQ